MRSSNSRVVKSIVMALLVAACVSTTSPAPAATPASGATQAPPSSSPIGPVNMPIVAGGAHTCMLTGSGGVKCWGASYGSFVPIDVPGLESDVMAIAAGDQHTCAVIRGGAVKCWGINTDGRLGNGTTTDSTEPVGVTGLASKATAIAAGNAHTCAVADGAVKCWGGNSSGQLGSGTNTDSVVPVDVSGLARGAGAAAAVTAGSLHTCLLTSGGGVKCWGDNSSGQLGDGTTANSAIPVDVAGLASGVSAIAAGGVHTCALTNIGRVKCWGANNDGQLGNGTTADSLVPVDVANLGSGVGAIAAGGSQTCVLARSGFTDGAVECWGSNLGDGTTASSSIPVEVSLGTKVSAIAVGSAHACALASDTLVKCWGWNYLGQLGTGAPCVRDSSIPVDVVFAAPSPGSGPTGTPIAMIEHATGPTDVLLRFDEVVVLRDVSAVIDDTRGQWFMPGPEFTLYGDGTIVFRSDLEPTPAADGPIVRARPFRIAHLEDDQVQSLLRFAIGEGGLRDACEAYPAQTDTDVTSVFTIRAGGLDKRVEVAGPNPLEPLAHRLRDYGTQGSLGAQVYVPDRYHGKLVHLDDLAHAEAIPWPWPGIAPEDFVVPAEYAFITEGHRGMSAREASVLGLSSDGGVVQRVYLLAPDRNTTYAFSLWPVFPDEMG